MNLKDDSEGTIRALVKVEGERWLERQKAGEFKGFSVFEAIELLKGNDVPGSDFSVGVIYGDGGWNRYRVQACGKVQFIKAMAWGREAVDKARDAGFEIW